ncbi:NAD(P)/FAD-dependent oxidoreductase [Bacillus sp. FJAT-22090]|uniref:flavin-containing monooxygenase n=1 Tax=Bacillus sp. FJAT-22090 TaxID=1581038 RepID=UPI00119D0FC8|nr:NAD(P)/FAD-dependent oxidoreductase [Bacillus sp. FJAT-22090]
MYHTIVIGAGQAGLAMGYYLKESNKNFIMLDRCNKTGDVWRNRYDSLTLFTSRMYSSLPGLQLEGDGQGFPSKDEIASYLESYAIKFGLPIEYNTEVLKVSQSNDVFSVDTNKGTLTAQNIIIATGPFQHKRIPDFARKISKNVVQLHSSEYKNPSQLNSGNVLIVGGGNSGAQIAVELAAEKETFLAVSQKLRFLPLILGNKSIFWWFDKFGVLKATNRSVIGKKIQGNGDPIFGYELKKAIEEGEVTLKERVINIENNHAFFKDNTKLQVDNIIWATGFIQNYPWLDIDDIYNYNGMVKHNRGLTVVKGLYLLGLPWQYRRGSSLLQGVGEDAKYIMNHLNS